MPTQSLRSEEPERALPLFGSSFYLPVTDEHRAFVVDRKPGTERGFAAVAFSTATHESRHFHNLLFTTYGSVLARQHTRAALLLRSCFNEMLFRSPMLVVPLHEWQRNWQTLHVFDSRVEAPSAMLAKAASTARSAQSGIGRATCRCSTATSCRSTRISASLAASLRARSTSQPNTRTMNS
jgi:hypothetical protein